LDQLIAALFGAAFFLPKIFPDGSEAYFYCQLYGGIKKGRTPEGVQPVSVLKIFY
jgi:hypothetical protein